MILLATTKRDGEAVAFASGAELVDDQDGPAFLYCGLLFVRAGQKSAVVALREQGGESYRVRLPGSLLNKPADSGVYDIELELIDEPK